MKVHLQYGREGIDVDLPDSNVTLLAPKFVEGLADEQDAFYTAIRHPIKSAPLRELISATDRVAIVVPDITRPLPSDRLLLWLLTELSHVPAENITIINGTGSHRVNTPQELSRMLGKEIVTKYAVVNHNAHDPATLALAGTSADNGRVWMNREYVEADKRIVLGFIEPHFMAGFSGGYKGIFPALADIDSIMHYHRAAVIADPRSTWGLLEGNPTQQQVCAGGSLLPVDFCINVTLNRKQQITRFFCGDMQAAHTEGCAFAKSTAMVGCRESFPLVITTNGGYPLDQNVYQAVKGMSAGAQIVAEGGLVIAAAKCDDGFPDHGNFRTLLFEHDSPQAILDTILAPGFSMYDQWEAQLLAMILLKARVALRSDIAGREVRRAHLQPIDDISARVKEELENIGRDAPIAVLPEGPMTIPYLER